MHETQDSLFISEQKLTQLLIIQIFTVKLKAVYVVLNSNYAVFQLYLFLVSQLRESLSSIMASHSRATQFLCYLRASNPFHVVCSTSCRMCMRNSVRNVKVCRFSIYIYTHTHTHRVERAYVGGCIQKFPDWLPGARTANGTALCH
jgi:hypothetical protein